MNTCRTLRSSSAVPSSDANTHRGRLRPFFSQRLRCSHRHATSARVSWGVMSARRRRCDFGDVATPRTMLCIIVGVANRLGGHIHDLKGAGVLQGLISTVERSFSEWSPNGHEVPGTARHTPVSGTYLTVKRTAKKDTNDTAR